MDGAQLNFPPDPDLFMLPHLASDPKTTEGNRSLYQVVHKHGVVSANSHNPGMGAFSYSFC